MSCEFYWSELATLEKALLVFDPIRRMVPTTRTRMTAYSAHFRPSTGRDTRVPPVDEGVSPILCLHKLRVKPSEINSRYPARIGL